MILVLGGSGLLGARLVELYVESGAQVHYTFNKNKMELQGATAIKLDASDPSAIAQIIEKLGPEIIIDTIAHPSVDFCDTNKDEAYKINVASCEAAAKASKAIKASLVYISSSFVFGNHDESVTEEDEPDPISTYAQMKLAGEQASKLNPNHLILRTDQIFGWQKPGQKKSFVVNTLEKLSKGEVVEVCEDWYNSPTYVEDLAAATTRLLAANKTGIYHAVGSTFLNRVEWARKIARTFGKDESLVRSINSSRLNLPAKRPKCRLSNGKLQKDCGLKMRDIDSALKAMKEANETN